MTTPFWSTNPAILLNKDYITEIFPAPKMSYEEKIASADYLIKTGRIEGEEMSKGGKVKRKRWIQDALSGDHKGALREIAKRKHLLKGDENLSLTDLHKLEKMGGKTAKRAHLAETLRKFK